MFVVQRIPLVDQPFNFLSDPGITGCEYLKNYMRWNKNKDANSLKISIQ